MTLQDLFVHLFFKDMERWPLWCPIFLGSGIGLYFYLPFEPPSWICFFPLLLGLFVVSFRKKPFLYHLLICLACFSLGFASACLRTHLVGTNMLHYPLRPLLIEGKVKQVELRPTQKGTFYQRLLLTDLKAPIPDKLPQTIRLSLKGKRERLWPGQIIRIRAKLNPVSEPSLPGSFDFRRQAYFNGIGATGFALSPPEILSDEPTWENQVERRREEITAYFLTHLKPPLGAIAAALITGDKAAIPDEVREAFIKSGLAHILAISGLHLTIIAGVVFMIIRRGVALVPPLCLHMNSKKIAASGTILMTFCYLVLSGFGIPAQRAFIMISLVMGAIFIDRSALSMRTVAFAAFMILLITPESLLTPSFLLSFSAVICLIAGYESSKNPLAQWIIGGGVFRKFLLYVGGLAYTSFLATLATLPFTIYFFNRFSLHATEANLVAVPLTSLVIMPSALLTCFLAPVGLEKGTLQVFEVSLQYLLEIANTVSSWQGTNIWVPYLPFFAFLFIVFGGLWMCVWQQSWRRWGVISLSLGCLLSLGQHYPDLLIDGQGKVVGIHRDNKLYLTSLRRGKFTAESWQKSLAAQENIILSCENNLCKTGANNIPIYISTGEEGPPCVKEALLIHLEPNKKACPQALLSLDWYNIWREGAHTLWISPQGIKVETVRKHQGNRPWTKQAIHRKDRPQEKGYKES